MRILARPASSVVKVHLNAGQHLTCEVGAMVAMSTRMTVETTTQSRVKGPAAVVCMKGLKRVWFCWHLTCEVSLLTILLFARER